MARGNQGNADKSEGGEARDKHALQGGKKRGKCSDRKPYRGGKGRACAPDRGRLQHYDTVPYKGVSVAEEEQEEAQGAFG